MIRIKSLQVDSRLLPLSFDLKKGQVTHVIGPNGSGKSTLLTALSGVSDGYKGEVWLGERLLADVPLNDLALYRSYLSQSARPAFNLEVFQFLALSLPSTSSDTNNEIQVKAVSQAIDEICHMLEISDKLHRSIQALSGGEWQRVRLAGMCLQIWPTLNPYSNLLILDEPAAPLDIAQEALLYRLIQRVAEQGIAVIMANHDLNRTLRHADQVLLLDNGVLQALGSASEVMTPEQLALVFKTEVKSVTVDNQDYLLFG